MRAVCVCAVQKVAVVVLDWIGFTSLRLSAARITVGLEGGGGLAGKSI